MGEKVKLSGVPETMLQTVYARAKESAGRGIIQDKKAEEIIGRLDYEYSLADQDTAIRARWWSTLPVGWIRGVTV